MRLYNPIHKRHFHKWRAKERDAKKYDKASGYLNSLSPQEPITPRTTRCFSTHNPFTAPTKSGGTKIDADSPYTDVTDDMIERMLSQERDQPSAESLFGGSSQATDLTGLSYLISQFLPLKTYAKQF